MTVEIIRALVKAIEEDALTDYERAHSKEDELHVYVLREIANGHPDSFALAREALKSCEIEFSRYCA